MKCPEQGAAGLLKVEMEPLRVSNKRPLASGYEENYYRVIFTLFGLAYLFSYYYSSPGMLPLKEFLIPRSVFALLPLTLAAATYFSKWARDHIKDIGSGYFLVCSLYLVGFLAVNGFHTHYEIGIITLVLISNLHLNKVLYIVLYNVIVLTALEFVFITAAPAANIQPVLFFIFLLIVMLLCIFYQLYRIRYHARLNENDRVISGLISGNPDAWMIFEAPGLVAKDAGKTAYELFAINNSGALDQVSLRTLIAAGTANESDNIIKNILSGTVTGIKTQCRKQTGELFWTDVSAFRIPGRPDLVYCRFLDISQNKWSQENATENAIRFRRYLDTISEGMIICDNDGMIKMVNKTALIMLGSGTVVSFSGKQLDELLDVETCEILKIFFLESGEHTSKSESAQKKLLSASGKIELSVNTLFDIVESKTEFIIKLTSLQSPKQPIPANTSKGMEPVFFGTFDENLLLATAMPVAITASDGNITGSNSSLSDLTGYSGQELSFIKIENLVHPEDIPAFRAEVNNTLLENKPGSLTSRFIKKNGSTVVVNFSCSLHNQSTGTGNLIFIIHDITQYKKTETDLQEAGSNVIAVIENTDAPIFSIDFNHRITVMNSAFFSEIRKRTGKLPAKGDDIRQYLSKNLRENWDITIKQVMKGNKTIQDETIIYPDGSTDYFEVSYFPIATPANLIIGVSILSRKVTDRIKSSQELRKAKEIAEHATKAKSDFLATMSHEIRTPLNGLLGMTDLLSTTLLNASQQEFVDAIKLSGETLLTVINDVLDYSKIESGKMELESRPFEIRACIQETFDMLRYKALEKGNKLSFQIDEQLPESISGDKARLRQVLVNLVGNAIKFTDKGSIEVIVHMVKKADSAIEIKFEVKDTGIGMTTDQINRLFKSFTQGDISTFGKYGGSGLGLIICQRLTELMQGKIWVESTAGKGSTFFFTIVAKPAHLAKDPVGRPPELSQAGHVHPLPVSKQLFDDKDIATYYPLRILIAEDNEINRILARKLFQKLGYEPVMVNDGQAAVDSSLQSAFDLIFMDVQMPVMNGLEATSEILSQNKSKKKPVIVAMTAMAMEGDREKCLSAGMNDYVSKPVNTDTLKNIIFKWGKKNEPGNGTDESFTDSELVDHIVTERLKVMADDDPGFLKSLILLYIKQSDETVEEIYRLSSTGDLESTGQAAHKLKGSSLNLGAKLVAEICKQIEEACNKKESKSIEKPLKSLRTIYKSTLSVFRKMTGIT